MYGYTVHVKRFSCRESAVMAAGGLIPVCRAAVRSAGFEAGVAGVEKDQMGGSFYRDPQYARAMEGIPARDQFLGLWLEGETDAPEFGAGPSG